MFSLLLALIYMAFISLGLPDGLLGSAWPAIREEMGVPEAYMGIVSMIISGGTIVSSLFSDKLTRRLGTGLVTALSVMLTALALFGFSVSREFYLLCVFGVPYGLGAGAVDAALNNYVALHYSSRHMSWLHCSWGVGAAIGPYIMGFALGTQYGWPLGYRVIFLLQMVLTAVLFLSLPLWKQRSQNTQDTAAEDYEAPIGVRDAVKIRGVKAILLAFFSYCALESTASLWASSYLVDRHGMDKPAAATFALLFFAGITVGRFLNGFVADKFGDKTMIRVGLSIQAVALTLILIPSVYTALVGLVVLGLGCAPVYPSIIHSTPSHFGRENSHAIVGIQMAFAYCGATFMPPLFGLVAQYIHIGLFPVFMGAFALLQCAMTERVNRVCKE
ncbi:MAG: MFS transporter [Clostridia bacterium]|nr:MFS transporter [Clostridia bacterium]